MKTSVAITLIIAGTLLVMAPILADHLDRSRVAAPLAEGTATTLGFSPPMSANYRFGCWLTGSVLAGPAIAFSCRSRAT